MVSGLASAHDNPSQKGMCIFNKSKPTPCTIESGGGAGGGWINLYAGKKRIYIEDSDNFSYIGHNEDQTFPAKKYKNNGFFCTKQINGSLLGCFK